MLLVHGILGQRHVYWNIFRRRLQADGHRVHEIILPYGMLGDIRMAARFLADKVDSIQRGDGVSHVDLVCHSAGGLVARYYLKYLSGDRAVRKLITMGTPHNGTYFAYALPVPLLSIARQTRPGSNFLAEINGPGAVSPRVAYTNLWCPVDAVVIPAEHGILQGANNVRVTFVTHWGFLWRRDVYRIVHDTLMDCTTEPTSTGYSELGNESEDEAE